MPIADAVRVTEDGIEKPLAKVGLLNTVTRLRGYRQDILDERAGMAGADVVVEEVGAPVMLVVRLKVVDGKITEIETVATRSRSEGLIFNIDGLSAPSEDELRRSRSSSLARGRDQGRCIQPVSPRRPRAVNAPFTPDAYRWRTAV